MFDIGFWELLIIAVVMLLVIGPERLPEMAKQLAFLIRKARTSVYRLRSEMKNELDGSPFADMQKAQQEISDLKNDIKQMGRDFVDAQGDIIHDPHAQSVMNESLTEQKSKKNSKKKTSKKKTAKKVTKKKVVKKVAKKRTKAVNKAQNTQDSNG